MKYSQSRDPIVGESAQLFSMEEEEGRQGRQGVNTSKDKKVDTFLFFLDSNGDWDGTKTPSMLEISRFFCQLPDLQISVVSVVCLTAINFKWLAYFLYMKKLNST